MSMIAIDPGLKGGIAWRTENDVEAVPMPVAGGEMDIPAIAELVLELAPTVVVVEKQWSRPTGGTATTRPNGAASQWKFAQGYGEILGFCRGRLIPLELVPSQSWKNEVLKGTAKDKAAAIAYCSRRYPTVKLIRPRCTKEHDGMADALCILEYARRRLN